MSKLIEKLKQVSQPPPQPIGFKAASAESRLKIQLIASLSGSNAVDISNKITGADALLLALSDIELKKLKKTATDIKVPWGVWITDNSKANINQIGELGGDFIVFPASASVLTTQGEKTGKIIQIEPSINDLLLRTVNELPVDAVLLTGDEKDGMPITWQHLMLFRRFTSLINKSLLIKVPAGITDNELQLIWETGVNGVVVTLDDDKTESVLTDLRQIIDKLSFPSKKKHEKTAVTLPHIESKEPEPEEDEEEDE